MTKFLKINFKRTISILCFILLPIISGCSDERTMDNINVQHPGLPTLANYIPLTPYITSTPTQFKENLSFKFTPTAAPSQTPTPYRYTIVKDDTLTSIAFKHGVALNDLVSANPGIDPNFLIIGMTLTIPISGSNKTNLPEITPLPILLSTPMCYPESNGGLWCLCIVENNQNVDVENIIARIDLSSSATSQRTSEYAYLPITLLPAGRKAILSSYFPPPLPKYSRAEVSLISTIPIADVEQRYIDLSLSDEKIKFSENHLQAELSGVISVTNPNQAAETIWLTAFGYDNDDNPIGFRKWTFENLLTYGEKLQYKFTVNSLGSSIEKIEILYEAKP
jgi:LysM repeat protein